MNDKIQPSIQKASITLALFAGITTSLIAGTWLLTEKRIAHQVENRTRKILYDLIPENSFDNNLLETKVRMPKSPLTNNKNKNNYAYIAFKQQQLAGIIIPFNAPDGYNGSINILAGINADGIITGVRVIKHAETPGIGDFIDLRRSNWILGFDGKSLKNPTINLWRTKKDGGNFDQFTGATITPRAVIGAVKRALIYMQEYKLQLFEDGLKQIQAYEENSSVL